MDAPIDHAGIALFAEVDPDRAEAMIATVWARARTVAPCLVDDIELSDDQIEIVRSVVRDAIVRWIDVGSGVTRSRTAGDYAESFNRTSGGGLFRPDEIRDLQAVCSAVRRPTQRAFTTPMFPTPGIATAHPFLTA